MNVLIGIIIVLFVFFSNIVTNFIPGPINYWDEIIVILLLIYYIIKQLFNYKIKISFFYCYVCLFIVILIGLMSNIFFQYNDSFGAVFRDIIQFLKFPLSLLILLNTGLGEKISYFLKMKSIKKIFKIIILIISILGLISIFKDIGLSQRRIQYGIKSYRFIFSHPTYLVLFCTLSISYIESFFESKDHKNFYLILLSLLVFLTLRTKGLILISIYIFLKFTDKWNKKFKILYWLLIILIGYGAAYQKLEEYSTYSTSAREVLYENSIELAEKNFPLGTGFATFGSHLSWKSKSKLYNQIQIPFYSVENGDPTLVLGDAGLTYYIAQFGFLGLIFILFLSYNLYTITTKNASPSCKLALNVIYLYIIIALTSESILVNNGLEISVIISVINYNNMDKNVIKELKNEKNFNYR